MPINTFYDPKNRRYMITPDHHLDFTDGVQFRDAISKMPDETDSIEINLIHTDHIDSAALGLMMLLHERVNDKVSGIHLTNSSGNVKKVLDMSRFDKLFNIT